MHKKSIIVGLVLLLVGSLMLAWVFAEQKKEKHLLGQQLEKLKSNLDKINDLNLAAGETKISSFADIDYDEENLSQKLNEHSELKETRELILTISIVCILMGGAILSWWLLLWMACIFIKGFSFLKKCFTDFLKNRVRLNTEDNGDYDHPDKVKALEELFPTKSLLHFENSTENNSRLALLLSDEKSIEFGGMLKAPSENTHINTPADNDLDKYIRKTILPSFEEVSCKTVAQNLEKQTAESMQMVQTIQQASPEDSEPINNTLKELTQQICAIRKYASNQQDRVRKLQDGYDWNIIRTFCLGVIRCIDNLQNRINLMSQNGADTTVLEEIRDELIFTLESRGIEQFEPEINSSYQGQEKNTEAVKDKEYCEDSNLAGKIANIVRPGYKYFIDEKNYKIVRTAQVKLFSQTH